MNSENQTELLAFFSEAWHISILNVDGRPITLGSIVIGILALVAGIVFSKLISRRLSNTLEKRFKVERNARHMFESLIFYFLVIVATLFSLRLANIPITVFTLIGGALAIGFGFGSQNAINNFISGIILMIERPIKVGDFVDVEGLFGEVENIGMRCTRVLSYGNKHIIVPNSSFLEKNVINWTHLNKIIRTSIQVGVAYGSPTENVRKFLIEAVKSEKDVLENREPLVFFEDFGDNSLVFKVEFWFMIHDLDNRRFIESNIRFSIDRLFRENSITIAFPQRDVHLDQSKPLEILVKQEAH